MAGGTTYSSEGLQCCVLIVPDHPVVQRYSNIVDSCKAITFCKDETKQHLFLDKCI